MRVRHKLSGHETDAHSADDLYFIPRWVRGNVWDGTFISVPKSEYEPIPEERRQDVTARMCEALDGRRLVLRDGVESYQAETCPGYHFRKVKARLWAYPKGDCGWQDGEAIIIERKEP